MSNNLFKGSPISCPFPWGGTRSADLDDLPPGYQEATGSDPSKPETYIPQKGQDTKYAMLTLASTDRIRLIRFPESVTALVSEVIQKHWRKGIQNVRSFDESLEIKLKGNPFGQERDDEKVAIRVVIMELLNVLAKEGWCVLPGGGGIGRMGNYASFGQGDSIIFHLSSPKDVSWLCVSFDSSDLVHLINAQTELATGMIGVFGERLERCNKDFVSGNFELKFKAKPWSIPSAKGSITSRLVVLDLVQELQNHGYTICATVDLDGGQGGSSFQSSGETWFCYR